MVAATKVVADSDCTRRQFLEGSVAGATVGVAACGGDDVSAAPNGTTGSAPLPDPVPEPDPTTTSGTTASDESSTSSPPQRDVAEPGSSSTTTGMQGVLPPNIIFITLDDVGWSVLPPYGNPHIQTPAISSLAAGGLLFVNAFHVTSSCSSSRGTFLTGQYPHTHGLIGLVHRYPEFAIPTDYPTLPRMLGDVDYVCAHQGKWHVSDEDSTEFGFHENLNEITGSKFIENADQAIDFMRRHRSVPFYLELDFVETHQPWEIYDGLEVDPNAVDVLPDWRMPNWPELRELAAGYFGEVRYVDRIIADVLQELDDLGLTENTLIVLTSDNGAPFPGNKGTLYDRGIRSPLIVQWPAVAPAGVTTDTHVSTLDIPAAMALAAMAVVPRTMQGGPGLFDLLTQPHRQSSAHLYTQMTYHADYCPARAIRTDRWKYIRNLSPDPWGLLQWDNADWAHALLEEPGHNWLSERVPVELYDLAADPHEVNNLADAAEYQDVRAEMHTLLVETAELLGDDAYDLEV